MPTEPDVTVAAATPDEWRAVREARLAALADDPDAFCAVLEVEQGFDEERWRDRIAAGDATWLLARIDGEVVGVAAVASVDTVTADLTSFWVRTEARGRGVGSAVIEAAAARARELGATRLTLEVGDHNTTAQRLYARHGFVPTGRTSTMPPPKDHVTEHQLVLAL